MWYNGDPEQTVYEKNRNKKTRPTQKASHKEIGGAKNRV